MTSPHPLDRPVWSSLTSRQAHVALSNGLARRFDPAFGLFAAAADASPQSLAALTALVAKRDVVAIVEAEPQPPLPGVKAEAHVVWQMVTGRPADWPAPAFEVVPLTAADAPQMLALATLTKPGPFFARTHELGNFVGVKRDGELVAMAGERMKPNGFTELSGVCTAPSHRGLGYAGALSHLIATGILARGEMPFLHVFAHNTGAIALYQALGFNLRREMHMRVLTSA